MLDFERTGTGMAQNNLANLIEAGKGFTDIPEKPENEGKKPTNRR